MTAPRFSAQTLPPPVHDASAWHGPALAVEGGWLEQLDAAEVAQIEAASRALVERGADLARLQAEDFPLPALAPRLSRLLQQLLDGRGFVLLRGLPVQRWPRALSAVAFLGLGSHLGCMRPQNAAGHLLGHVRDVGLSASDANVRIYQTHERQTFHTDSCDIVGLLCLQTARSGGLSALVSSTTLYNEMRRRRPDLAALLFEPLATDRRGEVPPGARPWFEIPVFNWHAGRLSTIYQRQYIDSAQRFAEAPRLTPARVEALDLFDALANDPALMMTMALQPGDLQFVHNHVLLHDRTAFEDWPERERRRHLLRLWLAPAAARELPPVYAQRYGNVEPGRRGGIALPTAPWIVPRDVLEPARPTFRPTMSSAAAPPAGLGQQLKTATAAMHRQVERSAFMASLLRGQVDRPRHAVLLRNLQALYAALEEALAHHATTPGVAPVVMPELFRSRAIAADLQLLTGGGLPAHAPLARATLQYVERLQQLSAARPGLLVAHAYVRYLGDLSGGQELRRVVARNLGLAGGAGTMFYEFGDAGARQQLEERFRAGLEAVAPHVQDGQALSDEALGAFERHELLFEELAAA